MPCLADGTLFASIFKNICESKIFLEEKIAGKFKFYWIFFSRGFLDKS